MQSYIAQNYLTASKHKSQWLQGHPEYYEDFKGVDFCCALGANLNSFHNSHSLPTRLENALAERLHKIMPFAEKFKFLKTGSDACSAAVRIARAYTGKSLGAGTGYHGWGNTFISAENPGKGTVPGGYFKAFVFDHLKLQLTNWPNVDIAYCIIEPIELNTDVKPQLKEIRRLCNEKNIVLIFDEVITFGRVPKYCISNYLAIQPDIICGAKALGNGAAISFVGGKKEIMEMPGYFVSGTFFGERSGLEAAHKTLDFLTEDKLEQLWQRGAKFQRCFNMLHKDVKLYGYPTRAIWRGGKHLEFIQEMYKRGYLLHPKTWFLNFDHTEDVLNQFINDAREVCSRLDRVKLNGDKPRPIFKR